MKRLILAGLGIQTLLMGYTLIETAPPQTVIKFMITFGIMFLMMTAAYFLLKHKNSFSKIEVAAVLAFACLFQLTLLPETPEMSDDVYRYIWDGKLQAHGINPYRYAPDDPALQRLHSKTLPRLVNFPHIKTIYPPVAQLVFRASYHLFGESVTGLKAFFLLFQLGASFLFYLMLLRKKQNPAYLFFFAWNPLVVLETAVNGHLDVVMVFFVLAAFYFYDRRQYILSAGALACAVLTKLIPVVLLPLFAWELFKTHTLPGDQEENGWKRRPGISGRYLVSFWVIMGAFYVPFFEYAGNMFLTALNYSSKWYFNNPLFHGIHFITRDNPLAHLISFSLFSLCFLYILFSRRQLETKITAAVLAFIFLNPTIHPWYLIFALAVMCLRFNRVVVLWCGLAALSYLVVVRYKSAGIWEDSPLQLALQYLPVLVLAIMDTRRLNSKPQVNIPAKQNEQ